jgi:hypothetical protein
MKKLLLMTAALVATTGVFARKVRIQVDMAGQTVDAAGVHVAGNFATGSTSLPSWSPNGIKLTTQTGSIYSTIIDLDGDKIYEFKFVNGDAWGKDESVPGICAVGGGNGNRWFFAKDGSDTLVLPAVKYASTAPAGKYLVRFKVDMGLVASVDPAGVHVAGNFQDWKPENTRMFNYAGDGKFEGTVYQVISYVDSGAVSYKFVNGNSWGKDESVPSECAVDNNRRVNVSADVVLDAVCYAKCGVCRIVPKYSITFNVDVESICGVDSVDVAGGLLDGSWGDGNKMTRIGTSNKWTGSQANLDSGATVQFKYRYYKNGVRNWEQIASPSGNRELKLTGNTTLDANCFNTFSNCNPRPANQSVTFKVDLSNVTPNGNQYVVLDYLGDAKSSAIRMTPMAGFPQVYMTTVNDVCNGTVYWYFMNGDSSIDANKEQFADTADRACTKPNGVGGFNREFVRTTGNAQTLYYYFSSCKTSVTNVEENASISNNIKLFPNPANEYSIVEFNDNASSHNVVVMDVTGRVISTVNNHKYNTLRIDRENMKAGVYFINVTNNLGQTGSVKLIIE